MQADKNLQCCALEIWGGIECTINRVGNKYFDQLHCAGHYTRDNDIELIASLGIKKLRYPLLWEHHQPDLGKPIDWTWSEKQLNKVKALGITPIVGLVHHGSGPVFTDLLDNKFADLLADYAKEVATKFPWIEYYTPVNEPLTTARFSGLYGFWYPHKKQDVSFAKMVLNQLKAVVLSMKEIRKINPLAKLVQTEDLGKTYSTPFLQYQANFENNRRWLTYDVLCGKMIPGHPMWEYFVRLGIPEKEMQFFIDNPCPPDIMGMNYYVTSERFLDERISKYEPYTYGGNELHTYADVEVVRAPHKFATGIDVLLKEASERYHLPIAITEVHINCTRDEQLRWFKQIWDKCNTLSNDIHIRAVTAWSLLGAFGWNKLLTTEQRDYEIGAFDIRSGTPRPTAMAALIKELSLENKCNNPIISAPGWWQKINVKHQPDTDTVPPLLIIGKNGTLGRAFGHLCSFRRIKHELLGRQELDITDKQQISNIIQLHKPWAIINAAGYVRVDDAESDHIRCYNENTIGPKLLAKACYEHSIRFVTFSSDLVFDGQKKSPYVETDNVNPLNIYGLSKARAEKNILEVNPDALIIRSSSFFGPWDQYNFPHLLINTISSNQPFIAASDVYISPTYIPDLVNNSLDLLIDKEAGIWHLTSGTELSWGSFAIAVADACNLNTSLVKLKPMQHLSWKASRPAYSVMKSEKGMLLPSFEDSLSRYLTDRKISGQMIIQN
jgi:dTDP-4-dehydrorhamnose reductase